MVNIVSGNTTVVCNYPVEARGQVASESKIGPGITDRQHVDAIDNPSGQIFGGHAPRDLPRDLIKNNYGYCQEEYRARYVGYVAENGKLPNKREAFDRSLYLVTRTTGLIGR